MRVILLLCILCILQNTWAATPAKKDRRRIQFRSEIEYTAGSKTVKSDREIYLSDGSRTWVAFATPKEGTVLLGRLSGIKNDKYEVEMLLVDTTHPDAIVTTTVMKGALGETLPAQLDVQPGGSKIHLALWAKRTD